MRYNELKRLGRITMRMALAYSFIIQNEFLHSIKTKDEIKNIWPLKLKGLDFGQVNKIQTELRVHSSDYNLTRMYSMFYHHLYNEHVSLFSKYRLFHQTMNNSFFDDSHKKTFIDYFCKFQKVYFGFCKLGNIFKIKNAKIGNCYDLSLCELKENSKNVLTILLDNRKYLFSLTDIVNMFQNALTNMNFMISIPVSIKNPYTNNPFPLSVLYTMYFFLKNRLNMVPVLIDGYFRCNFDLKKFMMLYDNYIQNFALENYVKSSPIVTLRDGLCSMLMEQTMSEDRIKIHPCFPENQLLEIMRPYLVLYFKSRYSRTDELLDYNYNLLKAKLHEFFKYNPKFGSLEKTLPNGKLIFNTKYIPLKQHTIAKPILNQFNYNDIGLQFSSLGTFRNRRMGNPANTWHAATNDSSTESTDTVSLEEDIHDFQMEVSSEVNSNDNEDESFRI